MDDHLSLISIKNNRSLQLITGQSCFRIDLLTFHLFILCFCICFSFLVNFVRILHGLVNGVLFGTRLKTNMPSVSDWTWFVLCIVLAKKVSSSFNVLKLIGVLTCIKNWIHFRLTFILVLSPSRVYCRSYPKLSLLVTLFCCLKTTLTLLISFVNKGFAWR